MCLDVRKSCRCGRHLVQFHLRDNVMNEQVIAALYCPLCPAREDSNPDVVLSDNNWIIEYDMELARFLAAAKLQLSPESVDPGYLFDSGYATWQEMYPGEQQDILDERREIMGLSRTDPREYLRRINSWNIARVERLKADGWRKAQAT